MTQPLMPALWRWRQADLWELETSIVSIGLYSETLSQNKIKQQQNSNGPISLVEEISRQHYTGPEITDNVYIVLQ